MQQRVAVDEFGIRAMFSGVASAYGTHRPALCEAIVRTTGPILELGMGDSSTPTLHGLAEACGRLVCSYDHELSWVERFIGLRGENHRIEQVSSWDDCPIEATRWSVALVDHAPAARRVVDIERLAHQAQVLVVHDSEDSAYGYERVFSMFAHQLDYRDRRPWTTLLSNYVDVSRWTSVPRALISTAPRQLRVSVVVPCAAKHVARLPELMMALHAQLRRPDEVIVVVSGCAAADVPNLGVAVVHSPQLLSAGAARNRGTDVATGDVVVYQDADDLPHPQRVEIVAGLFELYAIDHLAHGFRREAIVQHFSLSEAVAQTTYKSDLAPDITNGNVAVARALATRVRWPEHFGLGEDQEFNRAIYAGTERTAVCTLPLLTYRQNFSTFG